MSNLDEVNREIKNLEYRYTIDWRIFSLMIILVRLVAKILDRMECEI